MARIFDYIANKGSLYSETGVLGVITGGLLHIKTNKGWMLPCTASKYITFTLPSLQQKAIITVTKVNNTYIVTQTNTTATITSLVLNNANYLRYIIYDSVASATSDLKNIQAWVNILQPLTYQKRLLSLPKPTELKQNGLVAAYNMKPVGNVLHDISGNGNNHIITKCFNTVKGLLYVGTESIASTATATYGINKLNSLSVRFTSYNYNLDSLIIDSHSAAGYFQIYIAKTTGSLVFFSLGGGIKTFNYVIPLNKTLNLTLNITNNEILLYINGIYTETLSALTINTVTIPAFSGIGSKFNGKIEDLRVFNKQLSIQEIKAYHNSFNEVILHEKFEDMAVGSSKLPSGWIKNGGSFVCGESTTNDPVIKSIRKGTKYLRCVTAGIVAIPCKWVNGTTKINLFKVGNTVNDWLFTSTVIGAFNTTGQNGYLLRWDTDNKFKLYKITNGVLSAALITSVNTYPPSWYEPTVTRTTSGVFTVYINGVSIGTATDTTFNTSNYNQHSCIANDRITNINIQSQIKA